MFIFFYYYYFILFFSMYIGKVLLEFGRNVKAKVQAYLLCTVLDEAAPVPSTQVKGTEPSKSSTGTL